MTNPFTLTFGKKPEEYIIRHENTENILNSFLEEPARCQTYLIKGVRGSGKTVLMTAISKELAEHDDWVCVDLNSSQNLISDFAYRLSDACRRLNNIFDRGFDISVAGFGIGIGEREDRDSVSRCESLLEILAKKNKKVLITIDEVYNDTSMKQFVSQFQIWIRKDYPLFLLMTGLYENINAIQNNPKLTFLLRSPKISLEPLGLSQIARQYEKTLNLTTEDAMYLSRITKGYAFAFQALGMLYWDEKSKNKTINWDSILRELEILLDEYVYQKIWTGLSEQDQNILRCMPAEGTIKTSEICEKVNISTQNFSKYRERLINKGLIQSVAHGYIELTLPCFAQVIKYYD